MAMKKFNIRGVAFFTERRLYIRYVDSLLKTYNEVDCIFFDAIKGDNVWTR